MFFGAIGLFTWGQRCAGFAALSAALMLTISCQDATPAASQANTPSESAAVAGTMAGNGGASPGGDSGGFGQMTGGAGGAGAAPGPPGVDAAMGTPMADASVEPAVPPPPVQPCRSACTKYDAPMLAGRISEAGLDALSGMAASWKNPGVVFVHNDRDRAAFAAVDLDARVVGHYTMTGATVADIEDMEVSRCPQGTCVFIADIGNNISPRSQFAIYRAVEPQVDASSPTSGALPAERFAFRYEDGSHNAESLIIDASSGNVFIVTKVAAGSASTVYRLETFQPEMVNVARKVADLPVPSSRDQPATAGSGHPCGTGFLLRTGNTLYEFSIAPGQTFVDAFSAPAVEVPVANEPQGEAVSYLPSGDGYVTTSERGDPPLNIVRCAAVTM